MQIPDDVLKELPLLAAAGKDAIDDGIISGQDTPDQHAGFTRAYRVVAAWLRQVGYL